MSPSKISIIAAALSLAFVGACNRADKTADNTYDNKPATTADQPATDTTAPADTTAATTPSSTTAGTNTAATDATGTTGTTSTTGTEPASPTSTSPTTMADATTSFDDMDTNNDGSISRDELSDTSSLRKNFSSADKDGNGSLSRAEVEAQRQTMPPSGG
jgi:hypothetical protein